MQVVLQEVELVIMLGRLKVLARIAVEQTPVRALVLSIEFAKLPQLEMRCPHTK
jgi:hypothetical protein